MELPDRTRIPIRRTFGPHLLDGPRLVSVTTNFATLAELLYDAQAQWTADTDFDTGDRVVATVDNGFAYEIADPDDELSSSGVPAVTGLVEPTWPTTVGETVLDGGITWTCTLKGCIQPGLEVLTLIPESSGVTWTDDIDGADADSPLWPEPGAELRCSEDDIIEHTFYADAIDMQVIQEG